MTEANEARVIGESLWRARGMIGLACLEDTEPGDVFYLLGKPSRVWYRYSSSGPEDHWDEGYEFLEIGGDVWRALPDLGEPRTRVVVIHNTARKTPEKVARGAGEG